MRLLKRIIVLCLSLAIMGCAVFSVSSSERYPVTGYYGTESQPLPYPVTSRFMDTHCPDSGDFWTWYTLSYKNYSEYAGELEYLSRLWYSNYCFGDPEVWHEAYLERFDTLLASADVKYSPAEAASDGERACRVDGYSWNGRELTVQCSGDLAVRYSYFKYTAGDGVSRISVSNCDVNAVLAIRDKTDGGLVCLGKAEDFVLAPEYRYGHYDNGNTVAEYDETYYDLEYVSAVNGSFSAAMPEYFDPENHSLELYFTDSSTAEVPVANDPSFYNRFEISADGYSNTDPVTVYAVGDVNNDGTVNLADVTLLLKYIAKWDFVSVDLELADVNGDGYGAPNLADVTAMLKLIAGWDV